MRIINLMVIKYNINIAIFITVSIKFLIILQMMISTSPLILHHKNDHDSEVMASPLKKSTMHYYIFILVGNVGECNVRHLYCSELSPALVEDDPQDDGRVVEQLIHPQPVLTVLTIN
jgi:hypothetical protein